MTDLNPMRRRLLDYLSVYGLDGRNMFAHDWDESGYYAKVPLTGEISTQRFPWPEGFDYNWFCQLFQVADREDFRLAGKQVPVVG